MSEPQFTPPLSHESGGAEEPSMVLSQEELIVTTELVETGRVRLIKRVETETVTRTFELRREVLEIQRIEAADPPDTSATAPKSEGGDPSQGCGVTGPMATGSLQEGVLEIVLMQEEALISTQLVPRERVRLSKRLVTEERTVDADLRVERADLEQRPAP